MNFEEKKKFLLNLLYIVVILTIIFLTVKLTLAYLMPFVIGIIIAYIVQRPSEIISKKIKIKRGYCAASLAVCLYLIIIIILSLLGWSLYSNGSNIAQMCGNYFSIAGESIKKAEIWLQAIMGNLNDDIRDTIIMFFADSIKNIGSAVTNFLTSALSGIVKNIPTFFVSSIVTVIASCYIAKDYDKLVKFLYNLISIEKYKKVVIIKNIVLKNFIKFAWSYIILMLITLFELYTGFVFLKIRHAFVLAVVISLVDLLPVLGTGTILLPWALISFFEKNIRLGLGIVVLYLIVTFIRNILEPRIIGKQIGINPLFTLVSMFVGFKFAGIAGLIIFPLVFIVVIEYYKTQNKGENEVSL